MQNSTVFSFLAFLALLAALALVGRMDYRDAKESERHTCQMIEAGHWPADVGPWCGRQDQQ
jgi:hypothetical protein